MPGLPRSRDAYGRGVLDYLEGHAWSECVERDDGLIQPDTGPSGYFIEYRKWPAIEKKAMPLVRGRVLDVGAGAGRVSLELQRRGHDVVAIDNSPGAVEVCRRRGVKDARVVPFAQVGPKLGVFDTIVMFGNNIGLFGSPSRGRWMLRRLKKLTSPDARIVGTTLDPYQTDAPEHLAYHRFNRKRGRKPGHLRIRVRYKNVVGPWFDYLFVSVAELEDMLDGTGWHLERTITDDSAIYVAVLEKD
jgi:SAM-dependent methyltransferase